MSITNSIVKQIKEKYSLLFRLIILAYSLSIYFRYFQVFKIQYYLIATLLYLVFFSLLRGEKRLISTVRLLNDFAYITFVCYYAPTQNIHTSVFILLPLINSLNHTNESLRKGFSAQLYIATGLSYLIIKKNSIDVYIIFPIISITIINFFIAVRLFINKLNNRLDSAIEIFNIKKDAGGKSHKVLQDIMTIINSDHFLKHFLKILRISIYKLNDKNNASLIISSEFIYNFEFTKLPKGNDDQFMEPVEGYLNGKLIENSYGLFFRKKLGDNSLHCMLVEFESRVIHYVLLLLTDKVFIPVFARILNIINLEYEIQQIKREHVEKSKIEFENIDSAANAVHFLANKLSPITNYFQMSKDLRDDKIELNIRDEWKGLIEEEFRRSLINVESIQSKMQQIARYTNNPNIVKDFTQIKIKSFISYIRKTFSHSLFVEFLIKVDVPDDYTNKYLSVNYMALDFVFIEFIDNFNKHASSLIILTIRTNNRMLEVEIENDVKKESYHGLKDYIEEFNNLEINELLQRRGNKGIKFLKQFIQQSNILHNCKEVNGKLIFTLLFTVYEDSNF